MALVAAHCADTVAARSLDRKGKTRVPWPLEILVVLPGHATSCWLEVEGKKRMSHCVAAGCGSELYTW